MMKIKFNFNNLARVCHSLAACQRNTLPSLAAVISLSNNDVISLRSLRSLRCVRCVRCVGWKPRLSVLLHSTGASEGLPKKKNKSNLAFQRNLTLYTTAPHHSPLSNKCRRRGEGGGQRAQVTPMVGHKLLSPY